MKQAQPGQDDGGKVDPALGIHKSGLKDSGSCGLEKRCVGRSGAGEEGKVVVGGLEGQAKEFGLGS